MTRSDLQGIYRDYLDCLNRQDWPTLGQFVGDDVHYNGRWVGLSGYRRMLEKDLLDIPDLHFKPSLLIADPPFVACRIDFSCSPKGEFLGLQINGKTVAFAENVFYEFRGDKIVQVWSVIDKAAIERQL
jgi:predicted ester cyclase